MVKNSTYTLILTVQLLVLSGPLLAVQNADARQIIGLASEACKNLDFVEYTTRSEQGEMTVEARIVQQRADVKDVGMGPAKTIVRGELTMGKKEPQPFEFSYNGDRFKFHETGKGDIKTMVEPTPGTVGRTLGLAYFNLVQSYLFREKGLDFLLERADNIQYAGEVKLEGGPAHQIEVTQSFTHPATKVKRSSTASWFFDKQTHLPVRRTLRSIDTFITFHDIKNKAIIRSLTSIQMRQ